MEGEFLKLKKWGEDEETTLCIKLKSLELKRSDQMGSNPIDKNANRNPEFPWTLLSNTQKHNYIILKRKASNKDSHI